MARSGHMLVGELPRAHSRIYKLGSEEVSLRLLIHSCQEFAFQAAFMLASFTICQLTPFTSLPLVQRCTSPSPKAAPSSQELHVRAVCGLPPVQPEAEGRLAHPC